MVYRTIMTGNDTGVHEAGTTMWGVSANARRFLVTTAGRKRSSTFTLEDDILCSFLGGCHPFFLFLQVCSLVLVPPGTQRSIHQNIVT